MAPNRLFRLVLGSYDGRALVPEVPKRSAETVSDIDTAVVDSLKVLDPRRPIGEADIPKSSAAKMSAFSG